MRVETSAWLIPGLRQSRYRARACNVGAVLDLSSPQPTPPPCAQRYLGLIWENPMERRANRPRRLALLLPYWSSAKVTCSSCGLWSHPALSPGQTAFLRPRALPFPAFRPANSRRTGASAFPALRLRGLGCEAVVHGQNTCRGFALRPREQASLEAGRRCRAGMPS